jgi:Pentapeptide repeats (8 copies)
VLPRLTNMRPVRANLTYARLTEADLTGADLTGVRWPARAQEVPEGWMVDSGSGRLKRGRGYQR